MVIKKAIIFIDQFSKKNLENQKINVPAILQLAGEKFQKQAVNFNYDLTDIPTEYLAIGRKAKWYEEILGYLFPDLYRYVRGKQILELVEEMQERIQKELVENHRDLIIYFIGNRTVGSGCAIAGGKIDFENPIRNTNGRGFIVLGTNTNPDFKIEAHLSKYAETLMHEQCHLYGLYHILLPHSLMFPYCTHTTEQLDDFSKFMLLEALKAEENKPS